MAWTLKRIAVLAAFSAGLSSPRQGLAQEAVPREWLASATNERGQRCDHKTERSAGQSVLLACGAAGVWEIALEQSGPRFVRSQELSGEAIGFFTEPDGRVWVKLHVLEARPLLLGAKPGPVSFPEGESPAAPAPAPAPVAPIQAPTPAAVPSKPVPTPEGRVLRATPGDVLISLGSADRLARGDRIELSGPQPLSTEWDDELSREILAIGVVTHLTAHTARVQLGLNESVPVGAVATPTAARPTSSLAAPPRVSGLWHVDAMTRSFAAVDELGGGTLLSAAVGYRFRYWHLQALVDPLGIADVEGNEAVGARSAALLASYDSQYVEMGLGLGAQTVNTTGFQFQPGSGLTAVQLLRLGPLDGLNIALQTNVVLFHSRFEFSTLTIRSQIPLTRGYWLLLGGGGGSVGYGYGELGLRVLLRGNGEAGSKFLKVSAGGSGLFEEPTCTSNFSFCGGTRSYWGPMAGLGGEWRF